MEAQAPLQVIARIRSPFTEKFGIPRQSGLVEQVEARIVFEPEFRRPEGLRGLDGFSHLWLIWGFHQSGRDGWSPTVRPPRLGGNQRLGVFATRAPFRPNPIGLSCVRLQSVELSTPEGPVLHIAGADLLDHSPLYDIKPYLPYTDSHPEATDGFVSHRQRVLLRVEIPPECLEKIPANQRDALRGILEQDPRPAYQEDAQRVYHMAFGGLEVDFLVQDATLHVCKVTGG